MCVAGGVTLVGMVEPCPVVDAETPCSDVEGVVSAAADVSSLVVRGANGEIGLLPRAAFMSRMAGRYGYGRSLWGRQPVSALTTWQVPAVHELTHIVDAAALMFDDADGYRDLPVVDEAGEPIGVVRPVHVMRALAELTARRAATDELTGAASRAHFIEELDGRVDALADNDGSAVLVAFLDLDRLKPVNDLFGHSLGDALLRSVARRIGEVVRDSDVVGRLGGDEFAVIESVSAMDRSDAEEQALALGERLRGALAVPDPALPAEAESRASIGVAVAMGDTEASAVLRAADEAMYAAKSAGGDRVRLGLDGAAHRPAVSTQGLSLVFQPVVDARLGAVTSVEALLRERHSDGSSAFPVGRMRHVARSGGTLALDRWVLSRACAQMVAWSQADPDAAPTRVHVNLAPESLRSEGLASAVISTIDASGLRRDRVCLELSEHSGIDDLSAALPQLVAIHEAGIALALDDMGATLGALRMLGSTLPVDTVKVDRQLVVGAGKGLPFDAEMLSLMARVSDLHALEVIAEGVETQPELQAVLDAGIARVQGFLFARPLDADAVTGFARQLRDAAVSDEP